MSSNAVKIVTRSASTEHDQLPHTMHPVLRRVLVTRGVGQADKLDLELSALLNPSTLANITQAAQLLAAAVQSQQWIRVVGDFDADGATGTALAVRALHAFGHEQVDFAVPNRFEFGYGLTAGLVESFAAKPPDLILTVDSGISSLAGVEKAKAMGCQVIVTDHHLPGDELPQADAIVNPNMGGDHFPSKALAGVGVMFYVMIALRQELQKINWFKDKPAPNLANFLDLVALGTVADLVPLDHNNRVLVQQGLQRIRQGRACAGIQALLTVGRREYQQIVSSDLGFVVGPRLNAAGRLEDMTVGIRCLLTDNPEEAQHLAQWLDTLNRERQALQSDMEAQARGIVQSQLAQWQQKPVSKHADPGTPSAVAAQAALPGTGMESSLIDDLFSKSDRNQTPLVDSADNNPHSSDKTLPLGLCLFQDDWHQGVVGLVASKIKDAVHRPVIAFAPESEGAVLIKGSARSIPGVHIRDVLAHVDAQHPQLMKAFGGHAMAAGLSLEKANLETFREAFSSSLALLVDQRTLQREVAIDGELKSSEMNLDLALILRDAMPWGQQFPEPMFRGEFQVLEQRVIGGSHLRLQLLAMENNQESQGDSIQAIAFNTSPEDLGSDRIDILYRLGVNYFRGVHCQIMVEQILA